VKLPKSDENETEAVKKPEKKEKEAEGGILSVEKEVIKKNELPLKDNSIKEKATAFEKAEMIEVKDIVISDKITLTTERTSFDKKAQEAVTADVGSVSKKKIVTSEPTSAIPVYSYQKDPEQELKKLQAKGKLDCSAEKLKNKTNLDKDELDKVASDLENPLNESSAHARLLLIKAGKDGAAAAVKYLNSNKRLAVIKAVLVIREVGDNQVAEELLPLLYSESPSLRYHANLALKTIFNKDFDFHHNAGTKERKDSIMRWQNYFITIKSAELEKVGQKK